MHTEKKYVPTLLVILVVLCGITTAANIYLLRANISLKAHTSGSRPEVATGKVVKLVSGVDFNGTTIKLVPANKRATVLMMYRLPAPTVRRIGTLGVRSSTA